MEKLKKFIKNNVIEIAFSLFLIVAIVFAFVPAFNVVLKIDGEKTYYSYSILEMLNGTNGALNFGPNYVLLSVFILLLIGVASFYVGIQFRRKTDKKKLYILFNSVTFICLLINIIGVVFFELYASYTSEGLSAIIGFKEIEPITSGYAMYLFPVVVMAILSISNIFNYVKYSTHDIAEIAILCAFALVLDRAKIQIGATGGSINASAVPLFIIAIRYGFLKGIVASSVIFGFMSCIIDGYGIQYFPFDYLIAFSGYAFVGLFFSIFNKNIDLIHEPKEKNKKEFINLCLSLFLGSIMSFITRMVGHSLSSMIYYGYDLKSALIYNIVYVSFSVLTTFIISLLIAKPILFINHKYPERKRIEMDDQI